MNLNNSTEAHDYDKLVDNEVGPFNDTSRRHCFSISIIDDLDFENTENFMVRLDRDPGTNRVSVDPNTIHITITDNDSELFSISNKENIPPTNNVNLHSKWYRMRQNIVYSKWSY